MRSPRPHENEARAYINAGTLSTGNSEFAQRYGHYAGICVQQVADDIRRLGGSVRRQYTKWFSIKVDILSSKVNILSILLPESGQGVAVFDKEEALSNHLCGRGIVLFALFPRAFSSSD